MRKFKIRFEFEEPPINLVDCDDEIENNFVRDYKPEFVNKKPNTEGELYSNYNYTKLLLDYYMEVMGEPAFELSNEARAMLGHLVDYRLKSDELRVNLEKAYGHFRRLNIDAFKILCDEYDKFFSQIVTKLYKYDYRNVAADFLKKYLQQYFNARNAYLDAQNDESLGSNTNNVYLSYFNAIKAYIELKNYYLLNKIAVEKKRKFSIIQKACSIAVSLTCSIISFSTFW